MEYRKLSTKYYKTEELPDDIRADAELTIVDESWNDEENGIKWYYITVPVDASIFDDTPDPEEWFESSGYDMPALIEDVKKNGVRMPVIYGPNGFEGHHRMWAAYMAGLKEIPALMYKYDENI